jgi:hypothetical protein
MSDTKKHCPIVKTRVNNFDVGDKVIINKESPNYVKNSNLDDLGEGTIVYLNESFEAFEDYKSAMVVWDNESINLHTTLEIKIIDEESVKDRFVFDGEKLYFEHAVPDTIDDVLPLLYSSNYNGAVATYYKNSHSTLLQCVQNKYRSFDDIYYLFKAYFPETTHKDVLVKLLLYTVTKSSIKNSNLPVQFAACSTMARIRFVPGQSSCSVESFYNQYKNCSQYNSFKSWTELFEEMGIKTALDLRKFYDNHFDEKS